jgi:predicted lipid carrier protein YhbT
MSEQSNSTAEDQTPLPEFVTLYRRAFADYRVQALWNMRFFEAPTEADALVVARALRIEGDMQARRLAEQIEQVCRAAV